MITASPLCPQGIAQSADLAFKSHLEHLAGSLYICNRIACTLPFSPAKLHRGIDAVHAPNSSPTSCISDAGLDYVRCLVHGGVNRCIANHVLKQHFHLHCWASPITKRRTF